MVAATKGPTLTLVANPAAGGGRAKRLLGKVVDALHAGLPQADLRVFATSDYVDARARCLSAVAQARPAEPGGFADSLLVLGGDGTMQLGLNACAGTQVPLGLVPAGSGNDFARGVGVPTSAMAAVAAVVAGRVRRIDLMSATGNLFDGTTSRWVGSIVSTGFDSLANRRANQLRFSAGPISYAYAALAELARFTPFDYRLVIDGKEYRQEAMFICIGNAGFFGGGMRGCPQADVADGLLDLTVVRPVRRTTMLRLLPQMYSAGYTRHPAVELLRAKEVVVDGEAMFAMADGEELGEVPLRLTAVPDILSVYSTGGLDER